MTSKNHVIMCETLATGEKTCQIRKRRKTATGGSRIGAGRPRRGASDTFAEILCRFQRRLEKWKELKRRREFPSNNHFASHLLDIEESR